MNNIRIVEKKEDVEEGKLVRSPPSLNTCISFDDYNDDADITYVPIREDDDEEEADACVPFSFSFPPLRIPFLQSLQL